MSESTGNLLTRVLGGLAPRQLAWVFGILFLVNLVVPDPIPLVDEALLGLLTLIFARMKGAGSAAGETEQPMKNVTPPGP